ncbi:MAG: ArsA-related P-loop ATPase, partial [Deltaproteobacteria bacterium]
MADTLASPLSRARCVVCVGPGGVGKTSTSAAIAMQGAAAGRRTCVLTIDPARRLANALGMPQIGNVERDVDAAAFEAVGLPPPKGRMTAMMLDIKQTWDDVV